MVGDEWAVREMRGDAMVRKGLGGEWRVEVLAAGTERVERWVRWK